MLKELIEPRNKLYIKKKVETTQEMTGNLEAGTTAQYYSTCLGYVRHNTVNISTFII